jgi:hypothetical protein
MRIGKTVRLMGIGRIVKGMVGMILVEWLFGLRGIKIEVL